MRGKRARRNAWILRGALATMGLAGAVYAADQVTAPPSPDDVTKTITEQRIREGALARPPGNLEQREKLSAEQMIEHVATFESEMKSAYEHGDSMRIETYRAHDIIRMSCIEDKLTQIKQVMNVAAPRLQAFPTLVSDDLKMRQYFLVLQQANLRVTELAQELEGCLGDALDTISLGRIREETPETDTVDPTRPPVPGHDIERPGEASPYR
jgi:hypothetical protein